MNTSVRNCYSCLVVKDLSEFSSNPKDYLCKGCRKIYDSSRKDRSVVVNNSPAARARKRRWNNSNVCPEKASARKAVKDAVKRGDIVRPEVCEQCGERAVRSDGVTAIQGHHDDYRKPLDVRWLCPQCHSAWHRKNDAAMGKGNV